MLKLSQLAQQLDLEIIGEGDPEIYGITEDSRELKESYLFVAIAGAKHDGRDFIKQAIENGAAAVLLSGEDVEAEVPRLIYHGEEIRSLMAKAAALIYGCPADKLIMVGITGTNGKTTTTYLLEEILKKAELKPGVIGTIDYRWPGGQEEAANTTPEGSKLNKLLSKMFKAGCKAVLMETSSHALALGRTESISYEAALFTNLSRDHLDFHSDMEDYYQAKKLLFSKHLKPTSKKALINIDDQFGRRLFEELGQNAITYGFSEDALIKANELQLSRKGLKFTITYGDVSWEQRSGLLAEVNAYNILAASAIALTMDISPETIKSAVENTKGAPGRLELVGLNSDYLCLVDYAHSPDALEKVLKAARGLKPKRLIALFGCGGDRDKGKRPIMAKIGAEMADLCILSSDNPRTENPEDIISDMEEGLKNLNLKYLQASDLNFSSGNVWEKKTYMKIYSRREAINTAVRLMDAGDILIIAGKGHEDYQIIGDEKIYFDDREEVLKALVETGRSGL